jgi:hypothetical protein
MDNNAFLDNSAFPDNNAFLDNSASLGQRCISGQQCISRQAFGDVHGTHLANQVRQKSNGAWVSRLFPVSEIGEADVPMTTERHEVSINARRLVSSQMTMQRGCLSSLRWSEHPPRRESYLLFPLAWTYRIDSCKYRFNFVRRWKCSNVFIAEVNQNLACTYQNL